MIKSMLTIIGIVLISEILSTVIEDTRYLGIVAGFEGMKILAQMLIGIIEMLPTSI